MVDINLSDPFHSPKMSLDFEKLDVDASEYIKAQPAKNAARKDNSEMVESEVLKNIKNKKSCKG